jgi:hypothetical protein
LRLLDGSDRNGRDVYATSIVATAALGFGNAQIAGRAGTPDINTMFRVGMDDAGHDHARLQHAQLADRAATDEQSRGRKQRLAKCFLQGVQAKAKGRYASV